MFEFIDNQLIDFGYSLKLVTSKKKNLSPEKKAMEHPVLTDTFAWLESQISVVRYREMKTFVDKYVFHELIIKYAMYHTDADESDFLEYLRELDTDAFIKAYIFDVSNLRSDEVTDAKIKESLEIINANNLQKGAPSFTAFHYVRKHADELKRQFIEVLEYFLPIYLEAKEKVKPIILESKDKFSQRFSTFDEFLTVMPLATIDAFPEIGDIQVFVTGFMDKAIYMHLDDETRVLHLSIGSSLTYLMTDEYRESVELQFFKCFSDPTKLKILKQIKEKPMCADDLVQEMELSKSNISHHVGKLLSAQVIQLSAKDGKKMYYRINVSHMEQMFDKMLNQFTS